MVIMMSLSCISLHRHVDFLDKNQRRNEEYIMLQTGKSSGYCIFVIRRSKQRLRLLCSCRKQAGFRKRLIVMTCSTCVPVHAFPNAKTADH
ncbi:hypothetical protein T07_3872 [Trichinella nelsoni]|uniref:Uncharacterized protein n=1 Tax=Trichinella nelsoni TaxID=6336 RepID=A0A0V0S1T8_9BILA|nr:hypothetical protein T07_3872 [Trichinella nelsoni]